MLLILEIALTIAAWRRGWKGWALVPMGLAMALAFMLGLGVAAAGGTEEDVLGLLVILEILMIGALIVLAVRAPKKAHAPVELATQPVAGDHPFQVVPVNANHKRTRSDNL